MAIEFDSEINDHSQARSIYALLVDVCAIFNCGHA